MHTSLSPLPDNTTSAAYTQHYLRTRGGRRYPAEHLVRIFLGQHPRLSLDRKNFPGMRLAEVGCGDGRNLGLFHDLGFEIHACEITAAICEATSARLTAEGIPAQLSTGCSAALPWHDASFDVLVAWNSCYYLQADRDFSSHVTEYARVLKPNGLLILSVPMPSNYIYAHTRRNEDGTVTLTDDAFGVLQGARLHYFADATALEAALSPAFEHFAHGEVRADTFGIRNDHFLLVCRKSTPHNSATTAIR